jgi:hypothetical protein
MLSGHEGRPYSSPPLPLGEGGAGEWPVKGCWLTRIRCKHVRSLARRGADSARRGQIYTIYRGFAFRKPDPPFQSESSSSISYPVWAPDNQKFSSSIAYPVWAPDKQNFSFTIPPILLKKVKKNSPDSNGLNPGHNLSQENECFFAQWCICNMEEERKRLRHH